MHNAYNRLLLAALAAALSLAPGAASAQVFTPTFLAPRPGSSVGIYLSDSPGDLAVEGILRSSFGGFDLGVRGGIVDLGGAQLTLGGELRNPLRLGTAPVDMAFTAGIQGIFGDADLLGLQGGLSIGHTFVPGDFTFTPYIHPRLGLVDRVGPDDDLEADLLADLGLDFEFRSGISLRIGIGLEDVGSDWGIGLSWR